MPERSHQERHRPYIYYDATRSLCSTCLRLIDAKVTLRDDQVFLEKRCPEHGRERVLIAEDSAYYRMAREVYLKPSEMPRRFQTKAEHGCPFDCGLCEDHEQHSCLTVVEITDHCNLTCPVCYAASGPHRPGFRPLEQVEAMLDAVVEAEGEPDVVQLSGGEPTLHPDFFAILDAMAARPIRHRMVNTNGTRIAKDPAFVAGLAARKEGLEIYLQFDSLEAGALEHLRGADLRAVRERALAALEEHGISTTLVVTVARGVNDHELGAIVDHALTYKCIRGVTIQPVQEAGRLEGYEAKKERLTLTGVRRALAEQSSVFSAEDIVPVPCHSDALAMAYAFKRKGKVIPVTRKIPPEVLLSGSRSTIAFERDEKLREEVVRCLSTAHSPGTAAKALHSLLCCLPMVSSPEPLSYEDVFRVIILEFLDAASFDLRSVRKSCISIVHPETLRMIPFDTYNLFYRPGLPQDAVDALARGQGKLPLTIASEGEPA